MSAPARHHTLRRWTPPRWAVDPRVVDVALAAVVAVPTAMDAWWNEPGTRQADALTYALAAVSIVALLARRR